MGVPKFFRWVAERYPSIVLPFKDSPPQVDNLYLDMNGIIHNCTHTNDFDASSKAPSEEEMVQAMYRYLEKLFNAVKPRKYFVMAIDGCAPRAKMNQQRQRRYRSGYEMMVAREEALKMGQELPDEGDVFDSNCITPGTEFMVRMSQHFHYFVQMKLQTDSAWQNCKVVFSGHDHPGEGEHKIVDFVRGRKGQPDYDPNETHCMYGLDADLVMLALATHEPRFMLLREVVSFGSGDSSRKAREKRLEDEAKGIVASKQFANEDEFVLLHVNVLRDYLHLEIVDRMVNAYVESHGENAPETVKLRQFLDFERILDDFVFMCVFVGNDFLPSIPTVGINDGHLTWLMELYRDEILAKGEYLTDGGSNINWHATERILTIIGKEELNVLRSRQEEEAEYQRRAARRDGGDSHEVAGTIIPITSMGEYKERYYREKHGFAGGYSPSSNEMDGLRQHYIEGLMWVMHYYYKGPASWKWYYPHHYCPLASDLVNLANIAKRVQFELGEPFLPHQQLLAVLPPMSFRSMPQAYWPLLKSNNSPLKRYFPEHLQIDRDGSRAPWEGIVLIPFISEEVLLAAYDSVQNKLTEEDQLKNRRGKPVLFTYEPALKDSYTLRSPFFPPVFECRVRKVLTDFPNQANFRPKLCRGYNGGEREGWPSLHSKLQEITPVYEVGAVSNLGQPTRKESMLLQIEPSVTGTAAFATNARPRRSGATEMDLMTSATTAHEVHHLVGQEIFVEFPHYKRARVVSVRDKKETITSRVGDDGRFIGTEVKPLSGDEVHRFREECSIHRESLKAKRGIWIPEINVLVHVNRFTEMQLSRNLQLTRKYTHKETVYPLPICATIEPADLQADFRYQERVCTDADLLGSSNTSKGVAGGTSVVYIGKDLGGDIEWFGSVGTVMGSNEVVSASGAKTIAYTVQLKCPIANAAAAGNDIPQSLVTFASSKSWMSLREVAEATGVRALVISMLCSSITTSPQFGSQELGLCMKFTGKGLSRIGYAKRVQTARNPWYIGNHEIFQRLVEDGEEPMHLRNPSPQGGNAGNKRAGGGKGHFDHKAQLSENKSGKGLWYFSEKAVSLIAEYCRRFKPFVQYLDESQVDCNNVDPSAFMTGAWRDRKVDEVMNEITTFLKDDGIHDLPMLSADDDSFGAEHVSELEAHLISKFGTGKEGDAVTAAAESSGFVTKTVRQMNRRYLLFPTINASAGNGTTYAMTMSVPSAQKYQLGCRVVNCSTSGSVPFGAKGAVVRLLASGSAAEVVMDLPFPAGSALSGRLKTPRGAILPLKHLLVTHEHGSSLHVAAAAEAASTNPVAAAAHEQPRNVEALMRAAAAAASGRSPLSLNQSSPASPSSEGRNVAEMFPSLARASAVPIADNSTGVATAQSTRVAGSGMMGIPVPRTQQERANATAGSASVVGVLKRREAEASIGGYENNNNNNNTSTPLSGPLTKNNLKDVFASMVDSAMSTLISSNGTVASSSSSSPATIANKKPTAVTSRTRKNNSAPASSPTDKSEHVDAFNAYLYNLAQKYPQIGSTPLSEFTGSNASKGSNNKRNRQIEISKGENAIMATPLHQGNLGELMDVMTNVALLKGRQAGGGGGGTPPPPIGKN